MTPGILFLTVGAVSFTAFAQLVLKLAMSDENIQEALRNAEIAPINLIGAMLMEPLLYVGLVLYAVSTIAWLFVLAKVELSLAYPFVGIGVILTTLIGLVVLSEPVGMLRWGGVILIAAGIGLVSQS